MSQRKKIVTAHNFVPSGYECKKPGLTVPGQTLSLRSVLDRYRRGQSVQTFSPVYNPEMPVGYENLTKIEKIEMARQQPYHVARIRKALAAQEEQIQAESPVPISEKQ